MKKKILAFVCLLPVLFLSCAGTPQVSGLVSLEEAVADAVAAVEGRAQGGNAVAVVRINSPLPALSDFINNGLDNNFNASGKLAVVVRGENLRHIIAEQNIQLSGLVSDESMVKIGHFLGARIVVFGDFSVFSNFSSFFIRAVDVETAQALATYSAKIDNSDPVLLGITTTLDSSRVQDVSETALTHLNLGKDFYAAALYDMAIDEFSKAISRSRNLVEAYVLRGDLYALRSMGDSIRNNRPMINNQAIADFNTAIRLNPNNARAYHSRGQARDYPHSITGYRRAQDDRANIDLAIADYTMAIRLYSDEDFVEKAGAHNLRGSLYLYVKRDLTRARNDFIAAVRLNPAVFGRDQLQHFDQRLREGGVIIRDDGSLVVPSGFNYRDIRGI